MENLISMIPKSLEKDLCLIITLKHCGRDGVVAMKLSNYSGAKTVSLNNLRYDYFTFLFDYECENLLNYFLDRGIKQK